MKKTKTFKDRVPKVRHNPELDKYEGISFFPEKLAQAKEDLKKIKNLDEIIKKK